MNVLLGYSSATSPACYSGRSNGRATGTYSTARNGAHSVRPDGNVTVRDSITGTTGTGQLLPPPPVPNTSNAILAWGRVKSAPLGPDRL